MVKKIVWDKGHGGKDSGIAANGMMEKHLAHTIIEHAMSYMTANYTGFEQRTTRVGDTYPSLQARCDLANDWGADVFVSGHINGGGGTGYESLVYSRKDAATNSLQDNLNRELLAVNAKYGKKAHGGEPIKLRPDLHVLNSTHMPAVLTENLYLDSSDHLLLKDPSYLREVGEAHARGVAAHLGLPKKDVKPVNNNRMQTGGFKPDAIPDVLRALTSLKMTAQMTLQADGDSFFVTDATSDAQYAACKDYMYRKGYWFKDL